MEIAALLILVLFSLVGFAAIFFTTFGTLIILIGSVLYAFLTDFTFITLRTLLILLALYAAGEMIEYVSIIFGAKKLGASNAAVVGALIGGIVGAAAGAGIAGIGLILGAFLGVFLGGFLVELAVNKDVINALKAGTGGVLGRLGSVIVKIVIALVMFSIMAASIAGA
jgi:uncharacterized protein YqgC (DUF456 family)